MNIHQYIESGIVECYVLDLASPDEVEELERLLPLHPELQHAIRVFESQLESFAFRHQSPPPPGAWNRIGDHLRALPIGLRPVEGNGRSKTIPNGARAADYIPVHVSSPYIRVHRNWRTFLIIVFVLSKIFLALSIYYFIQYQSAKKDIQVLQQTIQHAGGQR